MTPARMAAIHAASFTLPPPWPEAAITATLEGRGSFVLVEDQAFLIGRVILDEAELLTIAVDPSARRQGLGTRLMSRFHDHAQSLGATTAFLEVAAANRPAMALYTAAGWQAVGRRAGYYRSADGRLSDDAAILRRAL